MIYEKRNLRRVVACYLIGTVLPLTWLNKTNATNNKNKCQTHLLQIPIVHSLMNVLGRFPNPALYFRNEHNF